MTFAFHLLGYRVSRLCWTGTRTFLLDWKQFVASVIGSLAWPVAVCFSLTLFAPELRRLLSRIKRARGPGIDLELSDKIEELSERAEVIERRSEPDSIALDPRILRLAEEFPEAAVLEAYAALENELLNIRSRLPDNKPHRNINEVLKYLADHNLISGNVSALVRSVRELRKSLVHTDTTQRTMTRSAAVELIRQIQSLKVLFEDVGSRLRG